LDGLDPAVGDDYALADVVAAESRDRRETESGVRGGRSRRHAFGKTALAGQQLRRDIGGPDDAEAVRLEELDHAAQHAVIAAATNDADDARQVHQEAEVGDDGAQVGALHAADDQELRAAALAQGAQHAADLPPGDARY